MIRGVPGSAASGCADGVAGSSSWNRHASEGCVAEALAKSEVAVCTKAIISGKRGFRARQVSKLAREGIAADRKRVFRAISCAFMREHVGVARQRSPQGSRSASERLAGCRHRLGAGCHERERLESVAVLLWSGARRLVVSI